MTFSSEIENCSSEPPTKPYFCGEFSRSGLTFSSEIEVSSVRARLLFFQDLGPLGSENPAQPPVGTVVAPHDKCSPCARCGALSRPALQRQTTWWSGRLCVISNGLPAPQNPKRQRPFTRSREHEMDRGTEQVKTDQNISCTIAHKRITELIPKHFGSVIPPP